MDLNKMLLSLVDREIGQSWPSDMHSEQVFFGIVQSVLIDVFGESAEVRHDSKHFVEELLGLFYLVKGIEALANGISAPGPEDWLKHYGGPLGGKKGIEDSIKTRQADMKKMLTEMLKYKEEHIT